MKKNLANIITLIRIFLSLFLLFFYNKVTPTFLIIFTIAACTDLIDGTIARMTHTESMIGSVFDTIADVLLSLNILKVAILTGILKGKLLIWLIIIFVIALASPFIAYYKFNKFYFVHSITAKIVGGFIYFVPYSIHFNFFESYLIFILIMFMLAMLDNLLIVIFQKKPDSESKSLISVLK